MQWTRKALTVLGGATLMALMLGVAAFAFSAAVQPTLFETPAAVVVGFAATADAQPSAAPIVIGAASAETTKVASARRASAGPAGTKRHLPAARKRSPQSSGSVKVAKRTESSARPSAQGSGSTQPTNAPGEDDEANAHENDDAHESDATTTHDSDEDSDEDSERDSD